MQAQARGCRPSSFYRAWPMPPGLPKRAAVLLLRLSSLRPCGAKAGALLLASPRRCCPLTSTCLLPAPCFMRCPRCDFGPLVVPASGHMQTVLLSSLSLSRSAPQAASRTSGTTEHGVRPWPNPRPPATQPLRRTARRAPPAHSGLLPLSVCCSGDPPRKQRSSAPPPRPALPRRAHPPALVRSSSKTVRRRSSRTHHTPPLSRLHDPLCLLAHAPTLLRRQRQSTSARRGGGQGKGASRSKSQQVWSRPPAPNGRAAPTPAS